VLAVERPKITYSLIYTGATRAEIEDGLIPDVDERSYSLFGNGKSKVMGMDGIKY
jgi:hypothetical protein